MVLAVGDKQAETGNIPCGKHWSLLFVCHVVPSEKE